MAEAEMKFCRDCQWSSPSADPKYWRCRAPENRAPESYNPVTGEKNPEWRNEFADLNRQSMFPDRCGPGAKWFQPKIADAAE